MVLCGISTPFGALSPCGGQVAHALLTRPPLESYRSVRKLPNMIPARLACVRHAASVRPEPGSNSYVWFCICSTDFHQSAILKLLTVVLAFLSLLCIVFKVRCSQASLYIIARFLLEVNTFFQIFWHLFLKIVFYERSYFASKNRAYCCRTFLFYILFIVCLLIRLFCFSRSTAILLLAKF